MNAKTTKQQAWRRGCAEGAAGTRRVRKAPESELGMRLKPKVASLCLVWFGQTEKTRSPTLEANSLSSEPPGKHKREDRQKLINTQRGDN